MVEILQMDFTLLTCSILLSLEFKLASIKTGNAKLEFQIRYIIIFIAKNTR